MIFLIVGQRVLKCPCPKDYVGKTKLEFRRRILDHDGDLKNRRYTPLSGHMWDKHNGDERALLFCIIKRVRPSPRQGDWDIRILQKEARWIH